MGAMGWWWELWGEEGYGVSYGVRMTIGLWGDGGAMG